MKLNEYNSKRLFKKHGIPIPDGELAKTPQEAREIAGRIGKPVVIKAQVLVGGRGKAGGVKLAKSGDEAEMYAQQILGMTIKGLRVRTVLVDEAINLAHEVYLGIVLDRAAKTATMMASAAGGMDIEEVARTQPEKIKRVVIRPESGLYPYQARSLAFALGLDKAIVNDFAVIAIQLSEVFFRYDATLAEINPLVITGASSPQLDLIAADGKIIVDDNALFRQPECAAMRDTDEEASSEMEARLAGLSFVKLDGNIGCMVNGAGLAMATMDVIKFYGGEPANFLDIGGGAKAEKVATALRIILSDPNVKAVLFNIFGGITRGDEVARGIVEALKMVDARVPMVARIVGTNADAARKILAEGEMETAETLEEGAQKAIAMARTHPN
jgi:succinyl-CoA synthetase beta subunit